MIALLIFGFLVILGVTVAIVFGLFGSIGSEHKKAVASAGADMDALFNGDSMVMFKSTPATLGYADVIKHAAARGYELTNQATEQTSWGPIHNLVFTKRQTA
jgi:hypothetical protein